MRNGVVMAACRSLNLIYTNDPEISDAMPPALTLSAQAVIGTLFVIIGLALATPLVALSIVLTRQLYIGDFLGDTSAKRGIAAGEPLNS